MRAFKSLVRPGLIVLGILIGAILSYIYGGGFFIGGAVLGGILAWLLFYPIQFVLLRKTAASLPYDGLDEQNHAHSQMTMQTSEATIRETRDRITGENIPPQSHC